MKVTPKICEEELYPLLFKTGRGELASWERNRPERVVNFAKEFTHEYLFEVKPDEVLDVVGRTERAYGDVQESEMLREIEDYRDQRS